MEPVLLKRNNNERQSYILAAIKYLPVILQAVWALPAFRQLE